MNIRSQSLPTTAMLLVLTLLIAACSGGPDADDQSAGQTTDADQTADVQAEALDGTVISYNSPEQWANWGGVLEAFREQTGLEAPNDPKNSGQTIAALQAEAAAPAADTAYYGIVFGFQAKAEGLTEAYQPPGFEDIPDELKDPDGNWMAIHQGAVAFLVNTDELRDLPVPRSWEDLTDPQYSGLVGFLDPTQAAVGYSVMTAVNLALGGTLDDFDPGIEWAQAMLDNDVQLPAQTATAAVQAGEIPILIDADFNGYTLAEVEGAPVEVVIPEEGTLAIPYVISLVADGPNPDNGRALIDFTLSDEGQALFTKFYLQPVRDVDVPDEIADVLLPAEDYARVATPDFGEMNEAQDGFLDRWNAEVVR